MTEDGIWRGKGEERAKNIKEAEEAGDGVKPSESDSEQNPDTEAAS